MVTVKSIHMLGISANRFTRLKRTLTYNANYLKAFSCSDS